jgi:hypothetical protein
MPLLNKENYEFSGSPTAQELFEGGDTKECWQLRMTGEIFLDYEYRL